MASLLEEMANREAITLYPDYTFHQVSSWDRTQTGPDDPKTWFNNADYGYYIRKEIRNGRDEFVILDEQGAGAIVRWEIPLEYLYRNRTVRIYIDGAPEPVVEENYHNLISGKSFIGEPFAFISSDERDSSRQYSLPVGHPKQMGANFYFPVTFSKSCKVTLDDNPFYYAIGYRIYPAGTRVEPFTREGFRRLGKTLESTAKKLTGKEDLAYDLEISGKLLPGDTLKLALPNGSHAIRSILLAVDPQTGRQALRTCVLRLAFDSEETSWCPVSEFFSGGVYLRPVWNRANSVTPSGNLQSGWIMPYRQSANAALVNFGTEAISVVMKIATEPYRWTEKSMYFHAGWREEAPIKTSSPIDYNYIKIEGSGVYSGDVLTVQSFSKGWWGEGDEKIYLNGESFPSQLGTGLEDYYGYSWGMAHVFSSPFISVPLRDSRGKADWSGYTTVSRIRLLDGIPFDKALDMNVEAWLHDSTVTYSSAVYWYGKPGARSNLSKAEINLTRRLPDFPPATMEPMPGTPYPDPAAKGPVAPVGDGSVRHAGNQTDLLEWRNPETAKPLDADTDAIYGTAGYYLINCRRLDARAIRFLDDSINTLPGFVESVKISGSKHSLLQDAWLTDPAQPDILWITGGTLVKLDPGRESLFLKIYLRERIPSAFRMGIMTDNREVFYPDGIQVRVYNSSRGDSGWVDLARSNRIPDWYFFDMTDIRPGDVITVTGTCSAGKPLEGSIGAIVFDLSKPGK
jgi:hypothetical protein